MLLLAPLIVLFPVSLFLPFYASIELTIPAANAPCPQSAPFHVTEGARRKVAQSGREESMSCQGTSGEERMSWHELRRGSSVGLRGDGVSHGAAHRVEIWAHGGVGRPACKLRKGCCGSNENLECERLRLVETDLRLDIKVVIDRSTPYSDLLLANLTSNGLGEGTFG
ncbi:hypothetical protein B0H11DRAFT_2357754 [Mycena galericulata]|nr:hypothetical protein B0H11DRAFT_2357754 [Mycena galericulata]